MDLIFISYSSSIISYRCAAALWEPTRGEKVNDQSFALTERLPEYIMWIHQGVRGWERHGGAGPADRLQRPSCPDRLERRASRQHHCPQSGPPQPGPGLCCRLLPGHLWSKRAQNCEFYHSQQQEEQFFNYCCFIFGFFSSSLNVSAGTERANPGWSWGLHCSLWL